jgi:hypothetical protein
VRSDRDSQQVRSKIGRISGSLSQQRAGSGVWIDNSQNQLHYLSVLCCKFHHISSGAAGRDVVALTTQNTPKPVESFRWKKIQRSPKRDESI